jgi:hypothetical protein
MSTRAAISDDLRRVLLQPTGGVIEMVDELLALCRYRGLRLDLQADRCRVRAGAGEWESLSPYGGRGELTFGDNPSAVIRVEISNSRGPEA